MSREEALELEEVLENIGITAPGLVDVLQEVFDTYPQDLTIREILKKVGIEELRLYDDDEVVIVTLDDMAATEDMLIKAGINIKAMTMIDVARCVQNKKISKR